MIAENNITEGLYFPIAHVDVEYNEDVQFPFPVKVSNATVDLLLTNIPSRISKSGSTYVTLTAVNSRENTVDSVIIIPESPDELEFSPNSVFVGTLDADTSSEASFSIKPHNTGNHSLNFTVQFKNGDNIHTELVTYSIEVVETLDVAPVFVSVPSSIEFGKSTRVSLEVYNAKTESITGVIVTPITAAKVTPSQYFIGSMDPDDVFSATFDIFTDDLSYGDYILSFKVSFKQDNEYYETSTISSPFSVIPASQINRNGDVILPLGALGIIIVVIVFFLFYMKRRRPSK